MKFNRRREVDVGVRNQKRRVRAQGLEVEGESLEREGGRESEADAKLPSWREVVRD